MYVNNINYFKEILQWQSISFVSDIVFDFCVNSPKHIEYFEKPINFELWYFNCEYFLVQKLFNKKKRFQENCNRLHCASKKSNI